MQDEELKKAEVTLFLMQKLKILYFAMAKLYKANLIFLG